MDNPGSIPGHSYDPPRLPKIILACRVRNNSYTPPGVAQK